MATNSYKWQFAMLSFIMLTTPLFAANELDLLDILESNFSQMARPVLDAKKPVVVTFGFELYQIVTMEEEDQSIKCKLFIRVKWTNEFIKWNPEDYSNITFVQADQTQVWVPDLFATQELDEEMAESNDKYNTKINMYYDGKHFWDIPVIKTTSCKIAVKYFPFDREDCDLTYASWTLDETKIKLKLDPRPIVTDNYMNSSLLTLHNVKAEEQSLRYKCCPNNFSAIKYTVTLIRKPKYYIIHVVVPCVIQMVIIWFSFRLPPGGGERVGVIITVLLVFAVYIQILQDSLPRASTSTPGLSIFYLVSMAETVVAFILTCITTSIHCKATDKELERMPRFLRKIFFNVIATFLLVPTNLGSEADDKISPCVICHQNGSFQGTCDIEVGVDLGKVEKENSEREEDIEKEWKLFARILDRLFFIVTILIFLISSLLILMPLQLYHMRAQSSI